MAFSSGWVVSFEKTVILQAYWVITSLRYITYMYEDRTRC